MPKGELSPPAIQKDSEMTTPPSNLQTDTDPKVKPDGSADDDRQQHDHGDEEGEDEGSAPTEGDYSGLKENQKPEC